MRCADTEGYICCRYPSGTRSTQWGECREMVRVMWEWTKTNKMAMDRKCNIVLSKCGVLYSAARTICQRNLVSFEAGKRHLEEQVCITHQKDDRHGIIRLISLAIVFLCPEIMESARALEMPDYVAFNAWQFPNPLVLFGEPPKWTIVPYLPVTDAKYRQQFSVVDLWNSLDSGTQSLFLINSNGRLPYMETCQPADVEDHIPCIPMNVVKSTIRICNTIPYPALNDECKADASFDEIFSNDRYIPTLRVPALFKNTTRPRSNRYFRQRYDSKGRPELIFYTPTYPLVSIWWHYDSNGKLVTSIFHGSLLGAISSDNSEVIVEVPGGSMSCYPERNCSPSPDQTWISLKNQGINLYSPELGRFSVPETLNSGMWPYMYLARVDNSHADSTELYPAKIVHWQTDLQIPIDVQRADRSVMIALDLKWLNSPESCSEANTAGVTISALFIPICGNDPLTHYFSELNGRAVNIPSVEDDTAREYPAHEIATYKSKNHQNFALVRLFENEAVYYSPSIGVPTVTHKTENYVVSWRKETN